MQGGAAAWARRPGPEGFARLATAVYRSAMGLFDRFRKKAGPPPPPADPPAARRFGIDRAGMFDIGKTAQLAGLLAAPGEERDPGWTDRFFDVAWQASVELADPQIFVGPDDFPYLRLNLPRPRQPFESQCLANLAGNCLDGGVGAAFFAGPDDPPESACYVLSLGVIDSLVRYDSPDGDPTDIAEAAEPAEEGVFSVERRGSSETMRVEQDHQVLTGAPSAEYLPPHLAHSLYLHLTRRWGMEDPGVQMIVDVKMRPHRSLVIGRRRSEFPAGAEVDAMAQALLWHLGPSRRVMLLPEHWSPGTLTPLRELCGGRL